MSVRRFTVKMPEADSHKVSIVQMEGGGWVQASDYDDLAAKFTEIAPCNPGEDAMTIAQRAVDAHRALAADNARLTAELARVTKHRDRLEAQYAASCANYNAAADKLAKVQEAPMNRWVVHLTLERDALRAELAEAYRMSDGKGRLFQQAVAEGERFRAALEHIRRIAPLGEPTYPECYRRIQVIAYEALRGVNDGHSGGGGAERTAQGEKHD